MFEEQYVVNNIVLEFNIKDNKGTLGSNRQINIDQPTNRDNSSHAARVKVMSVGTSKGKGKGSKPKDEFSIPLHTDEVVFIGTHEVKIKDLKPDQRKVYYKLRPFVDKYKDDIYAFEMDKKLSNQDRSELERKLKSGFKDMVK